MTDVIQKFVETSQMSPNPRIQKMLSYIREELSKTKTPVDYSTIQGLNLIYVFRTPELNEFFKSKISSKFKDIISIVSDSIIMYMLGGHIHLVVHFYEHCRPDLFSFALKAYFDSQDTHTLKESLQSTLFEFMINTIVNNPSADRSRSKSVFKNKNKEILKFKLNYYIDNAQPILQEVPQKSIYSFLLKFMPYTPILSGQTAMLRAIYQDKYYAVQHPDNTDEDKHKMFVFISCFDIPHTLCKVYYIDKYAIHVSRIRGFVKIYGNGESDPLTHILSPLYALRMAFRPHQNTFHRNMVFALCISAHLKLIKKTNTMPLQTMYSKTNSYLLNIQSSADQLISFLIYELSIINKNIQSKYSTQRGTGTDHQSQSQRMNFDPINNDTSCIQENDLASPNKGFKGAIGRFDMNYDNMISHLRI